MPKSRQLTKTFNIIIERMIATGQAPNYTEIAAELGVSPSEGRKLLRKLFSTLGFPGWFYRKTVDIESEDPKGLIGHVSVPFGKWIFNPPYYT
jgi:hypothetical protein